MLLLVPNGYDDALRQDVAAVRRMVGDDEIGGVVVHVVVVAREERVGVSHASSIPRVVYLASEADDL